MPNRTLVGLFVEALGLTVWGLTVLEFELGGFESVRDVEMRKLVLKRISRFLCVVRKGLSFLRESLEGLLFDWEVFFLQKSGIPLLLPLQPFVVTSDDLS